MSSLLGNGLSVFLVGLGDHIGFGGPSFHGIDLFGNSPVRFLGNKDGRQRHVLGDSDHACSVPPDYAALGVLLAISLVLGLLPCD